MLVEDDNNLREIYGARLLAEGYEIVSAKDGEEALALAIKERPDLIITDVMMPKISGFDMLDILRSTTETKNTKVIMMTALSQAEDKARADKLGADRYLVKSQVTLEDVAKTAREVLESEANVAQPSPLPTDAITQSASPAAAPATPASSIIPAAPILQAPVSTAPPQTNDQMIAQTLAAVGGDATATPEDKPSGERTANPSVPGVQSMTSVHTKVITPIHDITKVEGNLQKLLIEEEAKESARVAGGAAMPKAIVSNVAGEEPDEDPNVTPEPPTVAPEPTS